MKYVFLINSFSVGENINNIIKKIELYCKKYNIDFIVEINSVDESTEEILKKYKTGKNLIIPVGGDGIINRTLNSIVDTKNILGFIPYGTGNDFYKSVKVEFNDGVNKCDIVKINDKYFINTLCFGIDADIANNKNLFESKWIPKKQRYNLGILYTFFKFKKKYFEVKVSGEKIKCDFTTIAVCNGCYYGGGYNVSPNSKLNDGQLEVLLVPLVNKFSMIKLILSMKNGKHIKSKHIKMLSTKKIEVKSDKMCVANIDGEEIKSKKFSIEIIRSGIEVYYNKELIDLLED